MTALAFRWTGTTMDPVRLDTARERFGTEPKIVMMELPRSKRSHDHEFAQIAEFHASLPDRLARLYPSPEHLRKAALIATGWCVTRDYAATTAAEARRLCAALSAEVDEYAQAAVFGTVVRVRRAMSQSRQAMPGGDFQRSKTDVLRWIADLIEHEHQPDAQASPHSRASAGPSPCSPSGTARTYGEAA